MNRWDLLRIHRSTPVLRLGRVTSRSKTCNTMNLPVHFVTFVDLQLQAQLDL